ncbi:MAG: WD40 repeat protein [Candidatus Azotimanducaceae bacterium]
MLSLLLTFGAVASFAEDKFDELKLAIERADQSELQQILKAEIDLNHLAYETNLTRTLSAPIHIAVTTGNIDVIEQLIEGGANLNLAGESALQKARSKGRRSVENLLLAAGAVDTDKRSFNKSSLLVSRKIDYIEQQDKFSLFALSDDGSKLVTVESSNRLNLFNPSSGLFIRSIDLTEAPQQLLVSNDQLILGYAEFLEVRSLETLELRHHYKTRTEVVLLAKSANNPHLVYSNGTDVFSLNIDTGEQQNIYSSWSLASLNFTANGDTLFINNSFNVVTFDAETFEQADQYSDTYIGSQFVIGNQLIILDKSSTTSAEKGVKYIVLNTLAEVVGEFWVPRTFQQQNVSMSRFRQNNEMLVESFSQIAMSDLKGQSFVFSFGEFKFDAFEFHTNAGFILFNRFEIRVVTTTGIISHRIVPGTQYRPLATKNSTHSLAFKANLKTIQVEKQNGKTKLLKTKLLKNDAEVTALHSSENLLAAGFKDGSFSIWSLPKLKLIKSTRYLSGKVSSILLDEARSRVYLGGLGRVAGASFETDWFQMLRGHNNFVSSIALSTDGQLLITSGDDESLRFWDIEKARLLQNFKLRAGWLSSITMDDTQSLTGLGPGIRSFQMSTADLHEEMVNPKPRVTVQKANTNQVAKIVLDPTFRLMANNDGTSINIRDIKTGMLQTTIFPASGSVNDFTFTRDGNSLVLVSGNHVEFWDPSTGVLQKQLDHSFLGGAFHEVNAFPDLNLLLASNVHGWHDPNYIHANSGERQGTFDYTRQLNKPNELTQDITISRSGKYVAIFGNESIHLFTRNGDTFGFTHIDSIPRKNPGVTNQYWRTYLGFNEDERYLNFVSFGSPNHTVVYDIENQQTIYDEPGKLSTFLSHQKLLYMSGNTALSVLDLDTLEKTTVSHNDHNEFISALSYNPKENTFISADIWGNTITWDARNYRKLRSLNRFDNDVYTVEMSPDGRFLAYNNQQGIHLLDLRHMDQQTLEGTNYPYFGAFSHDSKRFYFRNEEDYYAMDLLGMNLLSMKPQLIVSTVWQEETTKGTVISEDDRFLIFGMDDQYHVYNIEAGTKAATIDKKGIAGENSTLSGMSFDPASHSIVGHVVTSSRPGFATIQLANYNYQTDKTTYLREPVEYDMSDEIQQYGSRKDIKVTALSNSHRYYAYSEDYYLKVVDLENDQLLFNSRRSDLEHVLFDDAEEFLILADENGYIEKLSLTGRRIVSHYKAIDAKISTLITSADHLIVLGDNEVISLYDLSTDELIVSIAPRGAEDFMIMDPFGYYYATKNAAQLGVAFRKGYQIYPFEQFDLQFNRPDKTFQNLVERGITDPQLLEAYTQAYLKRVQQIGVKPISDANAPLLSINKSVIPINTEKNELDIDYQATGKDIDSLHVWVNNVPILGRRGKQLKDLQGRLTIKLSNGRNKVQLAVRNQAGIDSLRETFEIFAITDVQPTTHLVLLGASEYKQSSRNLDFAVKDVRDVKALLEGEHTTVHMLTNEEVTRKNVADLKQKLLNTNIDDRVIVFYAGHGMLTDNFDYYLGTYDVDFESPAENGLSYKTLEFLFDGIPARDRLMMIDACHSGEADKTSIEMVANLDTSGALSVNNLGNARGLDFDDNDGATPTPRLGLQSSFNLSKQLFSDIRKDTGVTVISASGSAEFAWEDGELNNGVFTYSLLKGLGDGFADLDHDGQVKISELQDYVRTKVIELTNGLQQPTFRTENIDNDWTVYSLEDDAVE